MPTVGPGVDNKVILCHKGNSCRVCRERLGSLIGSHTKRMRPTIRYAGENRLPFAKGGGVELAATIQTGNRNVFMSGRPRRTPGRDPGVF